MIKDDKFVWDTLLRAIGNEYGVAGIMGNLDAESCIRSNNLQNSGNTALGLTDEQYTLQVDNATRNFIDNRGYGIAQWTSSGRKQNLLDFKVKKNTSIGDLEMQVEFLLWELKNKYPKVWDKVVNATSIYDASTYFLIYYEAPASKNNPTTQKTRADKGQVFYDKYHSLGQPNDKITVETIVRKNDIIVERSVINVS